MHRQIIRTFYEVRDGVVEVLHTDPVLTPQVKIEKSPLEGNKYKPCIINMDKKEREVSI